MYNAGMFLPSTLQVYFIRCEFPPHHLPYWHTCFSKYRTPKSAKIAQNQHTLYKRVHREMNDSVTTLYWICTEPPFIPSISATLTHTQIPPNPNSQVTIQSISANPMLSRIPCPYFTSIIFLT
jgi:hypothetical protein